MICSRFGSGSKIGGSWSIGPETRTGPLAPQAVEAELPGVTKDNLNVEMHDRETLISGELPRQGEDGEKGRRRRRVRRTGRFELRTILPGDINPDGVTANLSDGVLTVRVPKAEAAKPRRIEVTG
jgi:HSP20 family protein